MLRRIALPLRIIPRLLDVTASLPLLEEVITDVHLEEKCLDAVIELVVAHGLLLKIENFLVQVARYLMHIALGLTTRQLVDLAIDYDLYGILSCHETVTPLSLTSMKHG